MNFYRRDNSLKTIRSRSPSKPDPLNCDLRFRDPFKLREPVNLLYVKIPKLEIVTPKTVCILNWNREFLDFFCAHAKGKKNKDGDDGSQPPQWTHSP